MTGCRLDFLLGSYLTGVLYTLAVCYVATKEGLAPPVPPAKMVAIAVSWPIVLIAAIAT